MKKYLVLAVIVAGASTWAPAFAGGCGGGGGGCGGGGGGAARGEEYDCSNPCPLAQAANKMRATGREAQATSKAACLTLAAAVERNLAKI
jgi:hypothetical protein